MAVLSFATASAAGADTRLERAARLTEDVLRLYWAARYVEAMPKAREALTLREAALGPAHPQVATSLQNLGSLHHMTADFARARVLHQRALAIREQALGPTHPAVGQSLTHLAAVFEALGDYPNARSLQERALEIQEQALGPMHRYVAASLNNLGFVLRMTGDYARARTLLERALRIREQALGSMHVDVASTLTNLAVLATKTGDYASARPLYERALRIREQGLGPKHPDVAASLTALALLLYWTGNHGEARPLLERAVRIEEQALGPRHPNLAWTLNRLGLVLHATGEFTRARALYERALTISRQVFGPRHPRVAKALNDLARLASTTGDRARARTLYEQALAIARKPMFPEILWPILAQLAAIRAEDGRLDDAIGLYREAIDVIAVLSAQLTDESARATFLEAEQKLAAYDALARLLLKKHGERPDAGHDREALAVIEAKKGRIVAEALKGSRHEQINEAQAQRDRVAALEQALAAEQAKLPARQSGERLRNLTTLLAKTKAEYLALVRPLLERYRQHTSLFPDQQVIDPTTPAKFAAWLPAGTMAVGFFPSKDELFVFIVASGGVFRVKSHAVANPDGTLRMATVEVRALKSVRPVATLLEGRQATKAALLALIDQAADVNDLHFATHGFLDPRRPERSYLLMAGVDDASRRLEIREIRGLSLRTRLAILSACDTAVAEDVPGAALITLAAAFSEAGAETIVATLWKVEDEAAKDVMVAPLRCSGRSGR